MKIGKNIKDMRMLKGISQKELAERLNVTPAMISQYETGTRTPKYSTIERIAKALGCKTFDIAQEVMYIDPEDSFDVHVTEGFQKRKTGSSLTVYDNKILSIMEELNTVGKIEAVKRVEELTYIEKYTLPDQEDK